MFLLVLLKKCFYFLKNVFINFIYLIFHHEYVYHLIFLLVVYVNDQSKVSKILLVQDKVRFQSVLQHQRILLTIY